MYINVYDTFTINYYAKFEPFTSATNAKHIIFIETFAVILQRFRHFQFHNCVRAILYYHLAFKMFTRSKARSVNYLHIFLNSCNLFNKYITPLGILENNKRWLYDTEIM